MAVWIAAFLLVCLALTVAIFGLLAAGYRWGQYAAREVMLIPGAKWKAYVAALLPAAGFSAALHFDVTMAPSAHTAFFIVATAAVFGVFVRWNIRRE
jgi:hypothetical protein